MPGIGRLLWAQSTVKAHFSGQLNCWSLRCSWSIACRRCSNYIFILDLIDGFNGLGKDNCRMRRETFKFRDLVRRILETLRNVRLICGLFRGYPTCTMVWQWTVLIYWPLGDVALISKLWFSDTIRNSSLGIRREIIFRWMPHNLLPAMLNQYWFS